MHWRSGLIFNDSMETIRKVAFTCLKNKVMAITVTVASPIRWTSRLPSIIWVLHSSSCTARFRVKSISCIDGGIPVCEPHFLAYSGRYARNHRQSPWHWLIGEWKYAILLRPQAYHMAQLILFYTKYWVWKISLQDGCCVCWLLILSATGWQLQTNVWRCFTVDEIWIHYKTPETKEQSNQWTSSHERAPKKAKVVKSAGKVLWQQFSGIHAEFIDYLPPKRTINLAAMHYYAALLYCLNHILKEQRPHKKTKTQDNPRVLNLTNSSTNCFPILHISILPRPLWLFFISKLEVMVWRETEA